VRLAACSLQLAWVSGAKLLGVVAALVFAVEAQAQAFAPPVAGWIVGCWERREGPWRWREEWRADSARGLDGGAVAYNADTLMGWEFSRIVSRNGLVRYEGAPNGQPMHGFPLAVNARDSVVFADPTFAYPQRIVYARRGADSLIARAEGTVTGTARVDTYRFALVACRPDRALATASALRDTLQTMLDSIRALGRAPGISAAVALPDGRAITLVSGFADTGRRVALRVDDRLLAGSVGKTFFAALAMQLVAEGKLDLDAKISTWLGGESWFARLPNGSDIIVRQLMNHTSGLVRYEFDPDFTRDLLANPLRDWQVHEQLAYIFGDPPPFAAGQGWEYSDTNYLVLGLILERLLGGTAYDAITARFLLPFGLRGTVPSTQPVLPRLAMGYGATRDPLGLSGPMLEGGALRVNPKFEWAGGGFASTPEDLARWAQMWYDGRAVPPAQLEQALNGVAARGLGANVRYGLGVMLRDTPLGLTYGHSGFFPGYLTEMRYYPDSRIGVAVQVNTSDQRAVGRSLASVAHALAERAQRNLERNRAR